MIAKADSMQRIYPPAHILVKADVETLQAVKAGATLETGGTYTNLRYAATVLSGATPGMPAYDNELFGPVAIITTFQTDGQAVALANDTAYGLTAAVRLAAARADVVFARHCTRPSASAAAVVAACLRLARCTGT
jgi:acyl-CoA reductase-like NAD-dependent aldehyde dehydrogenase